MKRTAHRPGTRARQAFLVLLAASVAALVGLAPASADVPPYSMPVSLPGSLDAPSVDAAAPYTPAVLSLIAQLEPTATRPTVTSTTPSTALPPTDSTPTVTTTLSAPAPAPVTVTTTVTASPPSTPLTSNGPRLAMNQTATFRHFTVTVDSPSPTEGGGYTIHAEVCVRSLPPNPSTAPHGSRGIRGSS